MIWRGEAANCWAAFLGCAAIFAAGFVIQISPASAQTFDSYGCADGTRFILAFYSGDSRAHLQIDGRAVTLKKSLTLSGRRYSGGGVRLVFTGSSVLLRHLRRPVTACQR
jgi:membrane-bound inhibitor of C-type lysozyme